MEERILSAEKSEITEYFIYDKLAKRIKDANNKEVLRHISAEEQKHHNIKRFRRYKKWMPLKP